MPLPESFEASESQVSESGTSTSASVWSPESNEIWRQIQPQVSQSAEQMLGGFSLNDEDSTNSVQSAGALESGQPLIQSAGRRGLRAQEQNNGIENVPVDGAQSTDSDSSLRQFRRSLELDNGGANIPISGTGEGLFPRPNLREIHDAPPGTLIRSPDTQEAQARGERRQALFPAESEVSRVQQNPRANPAQLEFQRESVERINESALEAVDPESPSRRYMNGLVQQANGNRPLDVSDAERAAIARLANSFITAQADPEVNRYLRDHPNGPALRKAAQLMAGDQLLRNDNPLLQGLNLQPAERQALQQHVQNEILNGSSYTRTNPNPAGNNLTGESRQRFNSALLALSRHLPF